MRKRVRENKRGRIGKDKDEKKKRHIDTQKVEALTDKETTSTQKNE